MEISDEYQDMANPGGGVAISNLSLHHHHHHSSESPISHPDEDFSDPDRQDEESGEELPQQPLQTNTHSSSDNTSIPTSTPTPLVQLNNLTNAHNLPFFSKLKMEAPDMDFLNSSESARLKAFQASAVNGSFPFPFPLSAFAAPHHNNHLPLGMPGINNSGSNNAVASSASSHTSEESVGSMRNTSEPRETLGQSQNSTNSQQQPTNWSFEEQFKQVRQLYEINDDPKRKEFLDDLFSYMQKRGTPINRLPIMAKSVLDLYELYNLVIARGGLVDVINKKLWQEIIKGLHLPSSITSAAFTLRTQYMKYLYPYECEKLHLSSPPELQAAIDGNRREGRRSSYGTYGSGAGDNMIQRNPHTPTHSMQGLHAQMSPLPLVSGAVGGQHLGSQSLVNGSGAHTPLSHLSHHPHHPQGLLGQLPNSGTLPSDLEARMLAEYMKILNKEYRGGGAETPTSMIHRQTNASSPSNNNEDNNAFNEMTRINLWNLYNNNKVFSGVPQQQQLQQQQQQQQLQQQTSLSPQTTHSPQPAASSPEPQREALDLGLRSSPMSSSSPSARQTPPTSINNNNNINNNNAQVKRELINDLITSKRNLTSSKRPLSDDETTNDKDKRSTKTIGGTHIKIANLDDGQNGDSSIDVSIDLNGITYQGVLFAIRSSENTTNHNNKARSIVS